MANGSDFLEWLGPDISASILTLLDQPADIIRLSSASRSWHHFVIVTGFCKKLCLRMCPQVAEVSTVESNSSSEAYEIGSSTDEGFKKLKQEHRAYSSLCHFLFSEEPKMDCLLEAVGASSTDQLYEGIENTLADHGPDWVRRYWSSKGEVDRQVPETLTYRLNSGLCIVDEIKIKPFKVSFHRGRPIYSAEAVRFRIGHSKSTQLDWDADDNSGWLYVSPEYPMAQEYVLQSFKLPRPVICFDGIVQIELIGRVQRCYIDGLYYICVSHVQVIGLPLSPVFDVEVTESRGKMTLKYFPDNIGPV